MTLQNFLQLAYIEHRVDPFMMLQKFKTQECQWYGVKRINLFFNYFAIENLTYLLLVGRKSLEPGGAA